MGGGNPRQCRSLSIPPNGDGMGTACLQRGIHAPGADEHIPPNSESSEPIPAENAASSPLVPPTVHETAAADSDPTAAVDVGNYDHTPRASPDKTPDLSWKHKRLSLRSSISFPKR
jgi:hypothetical protein